jgi:hypothetical protein
MPESFQEDTDKKPADLFPDALWIWDAYCFLSEHRGVGPNGPVPITANDMLAYSKLTGRMEPRYRAQLIRFIPPMDRLFLRDFYDRQRIEMEKLQKKHATGK